MGLARWILPWGCGATGARPTGTSQVVVVASGRRPQQLRALLELEPEPELGLELRLRLELELGQQTT